MADFLDTEIPLFYQKASDFPNALLAMKVPRLLFVALVASPYVFTLSTWNAHLVASPVLASDILSHSLSTMATVRTVHAVGHDDEHQVDVGDLNSAGSWTIQGDCSTRGTTTVSRFSFQGKQTGRHPKAVNQEYLIRTPKHGTDPFFWWQYSSVWTRSAQPLGQWHRSRVTHDAQIVSSMCPSLIVPRLRLRLPEPVRDLGWVVIDRVHAMHLQSAFNGHGGGQTVDLFVDPISFRWVRAGLSGWGAGCCHSFHSTFTYSRYNVQASITMPPTGRRMAMLSPLPFAPHMRAGGRLAMLSAPAPVPVFHVRPAIAFCQRHPHHIYDAVLIGFTEESHPSAIIGAFGAVTDYAIARRVAQREKFPPPHSLFVAVTDATQAAHGALPWFRWVRMFGGLDCAHGGITVRRFRVLERMPS